MSLPLWEECAWYVDVPDPELELAPEPELTFEPTVEENDRTYFDQYNVTDPLNPPGAVRMNIRSEYEDVELNAVDAVAEPELRDAHGDAEVAPGVEDAPGTAELEANGDDGNPTSEGKPPAADEPCGEQDVAVVTEGESEQVHATDAIGAAEEAVEEVAGDGTAGDEVANEEFEDVAVDIVDEEREPATLPSPYKFPINRSINKRMYLYLGEIYKLPCDAIVIGQVESLTDRHDGNDVIFTLAGPELEPELLSLAPCTTGDSVITRGWQMPCEWIIHAVGPKYDARYLNASDHALHSAYKTALLLAVEKEVQSLVIGTIYKHTKGYPRFDAAHVALRTVRKFLEHSVGDSFDRVMFCVNTQEDFEIYSALMHAYFPRSQDELEDQLNLLPIELGDEWGEVIIPDRVVKVSAGPQPLPVESLQQYKGSEESKDTPAGGAGRGSSSGSLSGRGDSKKLGERDIKAIGEGVRSMTNYDHDPDVQRRNKIAAEFAQMSREDRLRLRFQAMAKDIADEEDLDELDALKLIHIAGKDFKDRTIVYLSGQNLMRAEKMDHDRVIRYLIKRMEPLRCVPFVLIYGCATLGDWGYPDTNFMQSIFDLYGCRYNDTLMKFYIMHASFSFRMYFWLLLPLETTTFWSSYTNLTAIRSLRHYADVASLDFPTELVRYDQENYPA